MKLMIAFFSVLIASYAVADDYRCDYTIEEANIKSEEEHYWTFSRGKGIVTVNSSEQAILAKKDGGQRSENSILNDVVGMFKLMDDEKELKLEVTFIEDYIGPLVDATYFLLGRASATGSSKSSIISLSTSLRGKTISANCSKL